MRLNATPAPTKSPTMERMTNRVVIAIFGFLLVLTIIFSSLAVVRSARSRVRHLSPRVANETCGRPAVASPLRHGTTRTSPCRTWAARTRGPAGSASLAPF